MKKYDFFEFPTILSQIVWCSKSKTWYFPLAKLKSCFKFLPPRVDLLEGISSIVPGFANASQTLNMNRLPLVWPSLGQKSASHSVAWLGMFPCSLVLWLGAVSGQPRSQSAHHTNPRGTKQIELDTPLVESQEIGVPGQTINIHQPSRIYMYIHLFFSLSIHIFAYLLHMHIHS